MSFNLILFVAILILYVAIAGALVRKYIRTRDSGFIWLGLAVLVWPLASFLLRQAESAAVSRHLHDHPMFYPFSLVDVGKMTLGPLIVRLNLLNGLVWASLVLVAVLCLSRRKNDLREGRQTALEI